MIKYSAIPFVPMLEKEDLGYEEIAFYKKPLSMKSFWQYLGKPTEWINRLACAWLEKKRIIGFELKHKGIASRFSYKEYVIDTSNLVRAILGYAHKYQCLTGEPIEYVLVGRDYHESIKGQMQVITLGFPATQVDSQYRDMFLGCKIVLVPQMSGIVFLPKSIRLHRW